MKRNRIYLVHKCVEYKFFLFRNETSIRGIHICTDGVSGIADAFPTPKTLGSFSAKLLPILFPGTQQHGFTLPSSEVLCLKVELYYAPHRRTTFTVQMYIICWSEAERIRDIDRNPQNAHPAGNGFLCSVLDSVVHLCSGIIYFEIVDSYKQLYTV